MGRGGGMWNMQTEFSSHWQESHNSGTDIARNCGRGLLKILKHLFAQGGNMRGRDYESFLPVYLFVFSNASHSKIWIICVIRINKTI